MTLTLIIYQLGLFIVLITINQCVKFCAKKKLTDNIKKEDKMETQNEEIIITFRGSNYNITNFLKYHPGGKSILVENNGKDVEELMKNLNHSVRAYQILEKYKISV